MVAMLAVWKWNSCFLAAYVCVCCRSEWNICDF